VVLTSFLACQEYNKPITNLKNVGELVVVYLDVLFGINFLMDYLLLLICGRFLKLPLKQWKLCIGALAGGLYSIGIFFTDIAWTYSLLFEVAVSALLVFLAYGKCKWIEFIKRILLFYASALLLAGLIFAVFCATDIGSRLGAFIKNGAFYFQLPFHVFLISAAIAYPVLTAFTGLLRHKSERQIFSVKITYRGQDITLPGFLDTGNRLTDPLSGKPVIIAEWESVKCLFGAECLFEEIPELAVEHHMRLIPYHVVGAPDSMLFAFQADMVRIGQEHLAEKIPVALTGSKLSPHGEYQLLLHTGLL
jgi:stage II sporulation protein GA (sporulation sigma-E factor processing peptidase)